MEEVLQLKGQIKEKERELVILRKKLAQLEKVTVQLDVDHFDKLTPRSWRAY